MNALPRSANRLAVVRGAAWLLAAWVAAGASFWAAAAGGEPLATNLVVIGKVEFSPAGTGRWYPATTNMALYAEDELRTGAESRAKLQLADHTIVPVDQLTHLQFLDRPEGAGMKLWRGIVSFFHRDEPGHYEIQAGTVNMVIRGTEFALALSDDQTTTVTLFDGALEMSDPEGHHPLQLHSGEVATARPGQPPTKTASVAFGDWSAVQWALYYPAILDPSDLGWRDAPAPAVARSWQLYQLGNLPQALAAYPTDRTPESAEERLFLAALLLSVGNVTGAEQWLARVQPDGRLAPLVSAHRRLITAVLRGTAPASDSNNAGGPQQTDPQQPLSATELLADSYRLQIGGRLAEALAAARAATERSPDFGFAWVRLAELEFSFGNVRPAEKALTRGLTLTPENAEGHALRGFILAAANRIPEAQATFQAALALDGKLGNAWLGRGLCRIRRGDLAGGRADLMVAVATEPQRSELRSYLGKALADAKVFRTAPLAGKAGHELDLARQLDPKDPTPWLYSALLEQQDNRVNEAITDLEKSVALNTNRAVFRSDFLLDQDRAVRGANLAVMYADAGMSDLSVREATRAVNSDYANASAHLFLADSYELLRDPNQVNVRYEAPWFSEFLLANLLAPVGVGTLSPTVSRGEYSKLFERDGLGVASETLWTSNGDWLESGTQFGRFGNFEYAVDALYRYEAGQRPNNELDQLTLSFKAKYQLSLSDTVFLQGIYYEADSGDLAQYYYQAAANPTLHLHEVQEPIVLAGWHHEWKPGVHTLLLVSPWNTQAGAVDPFNQTPLGSLRSDGSIALVPPALTPFIPLDYTTRFTGWSTELQQIWQVKAQTFIAGVRYQSGGFDTSAAMNVRDLYDFEPGQSTVRQYGASPDMQRVSVYAYDQWQLLPWALLTAGLSYDRLEESVNFTAPPLTDEEQTLGQVSPKVGLTLTPWKGGTVRGAYAQSLGGVSFDQSYRLEPVQVAGFTQTYRGLMPESLVGLVPGQEIEMWGAAIEQQLPTRTYLSVAAQQLRSSAERGVGAFLEDSRVDAIVPGTLNQSLSYQEDTLLATANQLVGDYFSLLAAYRHSQAQLDTVYTEVIGSKLQQRATLQQLDLGLRFNHPSGFFARWDSIWTHQSNYEAAAKPRYGGGPGDVFWQHNVWLGWRFYRRYAELAVGVLNLTDQNYQIYPLNNYPDTYRTRTFAVSASFNF